MAQGRHAMPMLFGIQRQLISVSVKFGHWKNSWGIMATAEEYDRVLLKAEVGGVSKLNKEEVALLQRLYKESGSRGNRARKIIDG